MPKKDIVISVQTPLYGLEAVYLACYSMLDRAYIRLEGSPKGSIRVRMKSKEGGSLERMAGEFENELLHQALRIKVASANQKIREHIVARALAGAQGAVEETADPGPDGKKEDPVLDEDLEAEIDKLLAEVEKEGGEDPLNIAAPWEEKKGKRKKAKRAS